MGQQLEWRRRGDELVGWDEHFIRKNSCCVGVIEHSDNVGRFFITERYAHLCDAQSMECRNKANEKEHA